MPYRLYLLGWESRVLDAGQVQSSINCALTVHIHMDGMRRGNRRSERLRFPFTVRFLGSSSLRFGHCPPDRKEECKGGAGFFSERSLCHEMCESDYRMTSVYLRYAFASEFYSVESLPVSRVGVRSFCDRCDFLFALPYRNFDPGLGSGSSRCG